MPRKWEEDGLSVFLKWIVCRVSDDQRDAFHRAQCAWQQIRGSAGLVAQVGGWSRAGNEACILGQWGDKPAYDAFMERTHDAVVGETSQDQTYHSCQVVLAKDLFDMGGEASGMRKAIAAGHVLRVADCAVFPERRDHFIDVQQSVWAPAMAGAPGQLGGLFSCANDDACRFLVTTFWCDESCHDAYVRECVPRLRSAAEVTVDLSRIVGRVVRLESDWCVMPDRRVH